MNKIKRTEAILHHIKFAAEKSPFYRELFLKKGIRIEDIRTPEDLSKLPFTEKKDLQERNADFVAVSQKDLIDFSSTSGTTGNPVTIALTESDLQRLALNEKESFTIAGITAEDRIQLMTTMDRRFMAGLAYFSGARSLGAGIIRSGNGLPEMQWENIFQLKPSVLIAVPSFIVKLLEYAREKNIDPNTSSVKKILCIGEALRTSDLKPNALHQKIRENWAVDLHATYASSEMATAFTECKHFAGGHEQEDLIFTEVIKEDGSPATEGESGEVVVTPIGVEGMPLLRFRTGDICKVYYSACKCGRKSLRLGPVLGRKNQLLKYKGTSIFPGAIFEVLESIDGIENYQLEVNGSENGTDDICVLVGKNKNISQDLIAESLRSKLRVTPKIKIENAADLHARIFSGSSRKPILFIDKRKVKDGKND